MSYTKLLQIYNTSKNTELEFRFDIKNRDVFKKLISSVKGVKTMEQTINFISPGLETTRICRLSFIDGIKKQTEYVSKNMLERSKIIDGPISYKIVVSHESDISKFDINLSKFARIKLRLSVRPIELPGWRIDFTLVKTVSNIKSNLKNDKVKMLYKMNVKDFINEAPWDYANVLELEIEHIEEGKNITQDTLESVTEYLFRIIDPQHKNTFEYQKIVHQIAAFVVDPKHLEKFKQRNGIRDLYNRVWELNKQEYYNNVFTNIKDFYSLDKADGVRTLVMIKDNTLVALNGNAKFIQLKNSYDKETIFDSEYIEHNGKGLYYIFDVLVYNGESLVKTPTSNRIKYISKIVSMSEGHVVSKRIIPLTENYTSEISELWKDAQESDKYEVDGIIFTPKNENYRTMKSWKWKPLDYMSIDFLVKKAPSSLIGVAPYYNKPGHTMMFLFSGIGKQLYDKLRLTPVRGYRKMFPHQNMYKNFPIQFSPSDEPFAYIYYHPDDSKFSKQDVLDNVCEFRRINLDTEPKWDMMKIRSDRKIELDRGNYFGNGFYVAEYTWQNYQNPLRFEDLIISSSEFMDRGYFREEKSDIYKPVTAFNSFVKGKLLSKFAKSTWLVDLAAGRGQDMFRVSDAKIENALFIDSDPQALSELISRKHDFQRGIKRLNTRIYTKHIDLLSDKITILKSLEQIGIPIGTIDIVMCNFAIHYFIGTPENIRNIIHVVNRLLKPGGYFFFTTFDGEKVFNALKKTGVWEIREGEVLKYSIKRKYSGEKIMPTGQQIDVLLPFSGGNYYTEYLVNFKYLLDEFAQNGFVVEKKGNFSSFLSMFKTEAGRLHKNLTSNDIEFLNMYSYGMVRKKMSTQSQRETELQESEEKISELIEDRNVSTSIYRKKIQEPWFSFVRDGIKTVEGRLNKGDWGKMKKGDIVTFENNEESIDTMIIDVILYDSFQEMLAGESVEATLPGVQNIEDSIDLYKKLYSDDQEQKHGVIAIRFKLII